MFRYRDEWDEEYDEIVYGDDEDAEDNEKDEQAQYFDLEAPLNQATNFPASWKKTKEKRMAEITHYKREENQEKKWQLIKDTYCKGANDTEFMLFQSVCHHTGLDPSMRQIWPVFRWDSKLNRMCMTVQVGIDGFRLIAERTNKYAPGREPSYTYDDKGKLISATAYVKKMTADGTWHEVSANALYTEYVAFTKGGIPTAFWKDKPHIMLAKCAEALALRKAFPAQLSGLYGEEEMARANEKNPHAKQMEEKTYDVITIDEVRDTVLNNIPIEEETYLEEYLEFVMKRVQKPMRQVLEGWLENPDPFKEHYSKWCMKKLIDEKPQDSYKEEREPSLFEEHA